MTDFEVLQEVRRVVEWRGGAVYRTVIVGKRWVPMGETRNPDDPDELYVPLSSSDPDAMTLPRRRR